MRAHAKGSNAAHRAVRLMREWEIPRHKMYGEFLHNPASLSRPLIGCAMLGLKISLICRVCGCKESDRYQEIIDTNPINWGGKR